MTQREAIIAILQANEIDPDSAVKTDTGPRRAFDVMEAHVMAGLDEIEEGQES